MVGNSPRNNEVGRWVTDLYLGDSVLWMLRGQAEVTYARCTRRGLRLSSVSGYGSAEVGTAGGDGPVDLTRRAQGASG